MKINITDNGPKLLTVNDLEIGEVFMIADCGLHVFLKINEVYDRCDIHNEIDCEHDLTDSECIISKFYNAICLNNGMLHLFDCSTAVVKGEAELTWKRI